MEFKFAPLSELTPDFSRGVTYRNTKKLARSIKDYGFIEPIIVDPAGNIICGNGRYLAAKALGLDEVPCVVSDLEPQKAREYSFVSNKMSDRHTYDNAVVAEQLEETPALKSYGFRVASKPKLPTQQYKSFRGIIKRKTFHRCNNFYFLSFLQATEKVDLKKVKHTPDFYEYVIEKMVDYIKTTFNDIGDFCIVYSPKRRTTTGNIAEKIACTVAERTGITVYIDRFACHNRNRYYPDFELVEPIKEHNVILIDDVLTSGATVLNCVKLLPNKNIHVLIGLLNQHA